MRLDAPSSTCINVSGTTFNVPRDLFRYLKDLPWTSDEHKANKNDGGDAATLSLSADPSAFSSLLYYNKHKSLPDSFWKDEEAIKSLGALAVVLGMADLVLYLSQKTCPKDGFLKSNMKRSSSWQKRARAESKRKLESLVAALPRKLNKIKSYKELDPQPSKPVLLT